MTTREDIRERLAYADALRRDPRASALVAEAVTWADALGEEDLQVVARLALTDGYLHGNEEWKALEPFVRNLARYQERPDLFDADQARRLRRHFTRVVAVAAANPKVAKGQVRQLEASLEELYRSEGASMHVVHGVRATVAGLLGLEEEAAEELAAWRATPRDDSSDCEGCDPARQVAFAYRTERWELAVATAVPVLRGEVGCGLQARTVQSRVLLPLLASGRPGAAWNTHLRSYRGLRRDPGALLAVGHHLEYLALAGRWERGMEVLRRHVGWLDQAESAHVLLAALCGMSLVLREVERAGAGEEALGVVVPAEALWCPHPAMGTGTPVSQAYAGLSAWARRLAAAYDRRNGNTTVSDHLERSLIRAPLTEGAADGHADRHAYGGGADSGTVGGADGRTAGRLGSPGSLGLLRVPEPLPEPAPTDLSPVEAGDDADVASALGIIPPGSGQEAALGTPAPGTTDVAASRGPQPVQARGDEPGEESAEQGQPLPPTDLAPPEPVRDGQDAVRRYAELRRVVGSSSLDHWFVVDQVATRDLLPPDLVVEGLEAQTGLLRAAALTCRGDMDEAVTQRLRVRSRLQADYGPLGACYIDLLNLDNEITADSIADRDQAGEREQRLERATRLTSRIAATVERLTGGGSRTSGRHAAPGGPSPVGAVEEHGHTGPGSPGRGSAGDLLVLAADALMAGASVLTDLEAREEALHALEAAAVAAAALPADRHAERIEDILDMARAEVLAECGDADTGGRLAEEVLRRHERVSPVLAVRGRRTLGVAAMRTGRLPEAVTHFREQTSVMMSAGIAMYTVTSLLSLGTALGACERYLESAEVLETALSLADRAGAGSLVAYLHRELAQTTTALGEYHDVVDHSLAAAQVLEAQGRQAAAGEHLACAAAAAASTGDSTWAAALFQRAAATKDSSTDSERAERGRLLRRAARALVDDSPLSTARSRLEEALALMQEARGLVEDVPDTVGYPAAWELGDWHDDMAWILWRTGESGPALEHCEKAFSGYMVSHDRESAARPLCLLARLHAQRGEKGEALAACARVRDLLAHPRWDGHDALGLVDSIEASLG
ncbi:hypothetical protein D5R93_01320 [Actinomyces lilanjuaniae]|uniref:Tetratricopeptide repeat protein n=1 Tax=Actinomyces lilanjuaniae TaxID=2321394 RepID=A0ABN5PLE6_9ACTO|nr:hypothetical protein [Actinomyces lilanjuaniae]AYD89033.1 hypothetical protein D5R93_01320 [Actinomyces lilanjuaniae]